MQKTNERDVLITAFDMFMKNVYNKTTTKNIAEECGINESTLFRKYNSKKALFHAAIEYNFTNSIQLDFDTFDYSGSMNDCLNRMLLSIFKLLCSTIPTYRLLIKVNLVDDSLLLFIKEKIESYKSIYINYFDGLKSRYSIVDLDSSTIINMQFGTLFSEVFKLDSSNITNLEVMKESIQPYLLQLNRIMEKYKNECEI
ncbi:TetR/AcrR family transcriptional regulator [Anaerorhabdus sp.]|uniref:TetR/AcrR family transcriptional regulator n=1 Tax=Anaerorhabdus sp. TaxID=1872524 RepID=UPI002FC92F93